MIIGDISEIDRLDPRLLGLCTDIESQAANDSASRSAMRSSFLSQMLVLKGSTPRRLVTLAEREYAKYTMSITMPCDGNVIKVLNKYPRYQGGRSFNKNPETTIIYENLETGEIGSIRVPSYHCNHKVFGFEYELNPILKSIGPGSFLAKDTILADSPSVKDGDYWFGAEVNTAFLSVPGIIEDGIVVSESFCKQFRTYCYGSKTIEWGHDCFPLNLYGTDDDYKIFPDIGEEVRKDGVLFATRQYDPILAVNNMTKTALRKIDHSFDNVTYISLSSVNEDEMPVIEDVNVWHTHNTDLWRTPPQMEKQVRKYHDASKIYNTEINRVYEELLSKRKQTLKTTDEFHALLVRCRINDNNIPRAQLPKSVIRTFRKNKLDDWRVEVSYGWTMTPGNQTKDSDLHGGKGVIVSVWKDEDMPIDDNGVRADMIVDGSESTASLGW